ncbi:uncharacterized protein LOC144120411 [Amblyomma americanum]
MAELKTDMAAKITDNKSGVPDRPTKVSQELRDEEAAYQRDVLGKDVPVGKKGEESGTKHEMTNLLNREEARLARIGQNLDKPEMLEQKLREQTTAKQESSFASTGNMKTDMNMRMTDDVRGPAEPEVGPPRPPAGGQAGGPPAGGAPPLRAASKEKLGGKATGTSYATDGNYPKTDMAAVITDHRSHLNELSKSLQNRVREEEASYARDQVNVASMAREGGRRGQSLPGGPGGQRAPSAGGAPRGSQGGTGAPPPVKLAATIYTKEEETSASDEQPRRACWLMPESVQRVLDCGMEKIYGPRPRRPYRPPMLEMEVEEDDYDPYFNKAEATEAVYKPEDGRVMYPSEKRRKARRPVYPDEEDFDVMFQDELVVDGEGPRMMYEGDARYADEGDMFEEETEDVIYMDDEQMMYQGNRMLYRQPVGQHMMQPMMQPMVGQPMIQPMMGQAMMQPMAPPMMQPMGQSMMPQMSPTMMHQMPMMQPVNSPMMQAMPVQQYGYAQQPVARQEIYDPSQGVTINKKDHIEVSSSDTDVNVKWTDTYAVGLPDELNRTGSGVRIEHKVKVRTQKEQSSTTDGDDESGKKSAAVQTVRHDPVSTTAQTERPERDSKSISARADTDDAATQRNRQPERAMDTQTFGTSPFVPGAGMPFMFPPGMMNPFMMGAMGMQQQQAPPPPPPPPEPPAPPPCEECAQLKSCCDDVPFEDLKKNIEEDIMNIVNENLEVKISDEDTKILVARPDSPYKLVYLIPQRPQVVKEEKSIQTAKEPAEKGIQTEGKKGVDGAKSLDGEGERVIKASYSTKECQVNGKRVRTTKAFRVTQSDDEKSATEVQESSSSSGNGRSKRRSRSKRRAKRARSDGAYPRSLTISVGRTSSTTDRSRSPSHSRRSPGAVRSDTPTQRQSPKHWREIVVASSSTSISSQTNVSIIGPPSNADSVTCHARAYIDNSPARGQYHVPSRYAAQGEGPANARCVIVTSDTNMTSHETRDVAEPPAEAKPKSNKVYVERIYSERPESARFSPRMESRACSPRPPPPVAGTDRPPSPRMHDKSGFVCRPPQSASSVFQSAVDARHKSINRNPSYVNAERIAKQIAQQIAPQIIAARQKEPFHQKHKSGQPTALQSMVATAQQQHQQQQQQLHHLLQHKRSQHRKDHETTRYEDSTQYQTTGRYTLMSQHSLDRLSNAQGARCVAENKVSRYGPAAPSLSQSFPQRTSGRYTVVSQHSLERLSNAQGTRCVADNKVSRYGPAAPSLSQSFPQRYSSGQPRRSATMSAMGSPLHRGQPRGSHSPYGARQSPQQARYILPIQLQVTGQPSPVTAASQYSQHRSAGSRITAHPEKSRSKVIMMQQQQQQQQGQLSSVMLRSVEPDSPPRMTPATSCHGDKKRAFYKRAYRLRIPAQEKQVLTYALVALVALISVILVINTLGKRRTNAD